MITVTKTVRFDAAHILTNHQGLCKNLHGHTYRVDISVAGDGSRDMVMDFKELKNLATSTICDRFDHAFIYNTESEGECEIAAVVERHGMRTVAIPFRSTAENLAKYFYELLSPHIASPSALLGVKVWETADSCAEYRSSHKAPAAVVGLLMLLGLIGPLFLRAERQFLWPEGKMPNPQAHQIAEMANVSEKPGFDADSHRRPYLDWSDKPAHPNGGCVILVSGGSYQHLSDAKIVESWREQLSARGFQTAVLGYRTPRPKNLPIHQSAWEDGQRAIRLARSEAKKRGYNPEKIGAFGVSAGGHLTCLLAGRSQTSAYGKTDAIDRIPCHLNWAVAFCPAYNTMNGKTGGQTRHDGLDVTPVLSDVLKFDAKTCPMSLHHGGNDPWTPNGSTLTYRELRKLGVPAELHLYADLGHGQHGFDRALEFMTEMNFVGTRGEEVLLMSRYPDDADRDESKYAKIPVWPTGKMPDAQAKQCVPYLEWHFPKVQKTKAIQIIYSGGAYNANDPNGYDVAPMRRFLNRCGMTVVTLKYRTPRPRGLPKHQSAWEDLQRTIRVVRSQAEAKGLDPNRIGIMGSSAGGHLTLMGAFSSETPAYAPIDELDQLPCNVQWAIAIYPGSVLTDGVDGVNKHRGNLDEDVLVPEFKFDKSTCPVCFIHGDADGFSAMGSVKCWEKLRTMGVQCDLHTLAKRGHCFQRAAAPDTGSATWMNQVWDFMSRKGFNQ